MLIVIGYIILGILTLAVLSAIELCLVAHHRFSLRKDRGPISAEKDPPTIEGILLIVALWPIWLVCLLTLLFFVLPMTWLAEFCKGALHKGNTKLGIWWTGNPDYKPPEYDSYGNKYINGKREGPRLSD